MTYECPCGYVYDEAVGDSANGINAGTKWQDIRKRQTEPPLYRRGAILRLLYLTAPPAPPTL
jgi:hypothetical protein